MEGSVGGVFVEMCRCKAPLMSCALQVHETHYLVSLFCFTIIPNNHNWWRERERESGRKREKMRGRERETEKEGQRERAREDVLRQRSAAMKVVISPCLWFDPDDRGGPP